MASPDTGSVSKYVNDPLYGTLQKVLGADDAEDLPKVTETLKDRETTFNFCAILNELLQPDPSTGFRMVRIKDASANPDETLDIIRKLVLYMHAEIEGNHSLGFQIMEAMAAQKRGRGTGTMKLPQSKAPRMLLIKKAAAAISQGTDTSDLHFALLHGKGAKVDLSKFQLRTIAEELLNLLNDGPPLFTNKKFQEFVRVLGKVKEGPERVTALRELVAELPPRNQIVAKDLFQMLAMLWRHSEETGMDDEMSAYALGPVLLRSEGMAPERVMNYAQFVVPCCKQMIQHCDSIFLAPAASLSIATFDKLQVAYATAFSTLQDMVNDKTVKQDAISMRVYQSLSILLNVMFCVCKTVVKGKNTDKREFLDAGFDKLPPSFWIGVVRSRQRPDNERKWLSALQPTEMKRRDSENISVLPLMTTLLNQMCVLGISEENLREFIQLASVAFTEIEAVAFSTLNDIVSKFFQPAKSGTEDVTPRQSVANELPRASSSTAREVTTTHHTNCEHPDCTRAPLTCVKTKYCSVHFDEHRASEEKLGVRTVRGISGGRNCDILTHLPASIFDLDLGIQLSTTASFYLHREEKYKNNLVYDCQPYVAKPVAVSPKPPPPRQLPVSPAGSPASPEVKSSPSERKFAVPGTNPSPLSAKPAANKATKPDDENEKKSTPEKSAPVKPISAVSAAAAKFEAGANASVRVMKPPPPKQGGTSKFGTMPVDTTKPPAETAEATPATTTEAKPEKPPKPAGLPPRTVEGKANESMVSRIKPPLSPKPEEAAPPTPAAFSVVTFRLLERRTQPPDTPLTGTEEPDFVRQPDDVMSAQIDSALGELLRNHYLSPADTSKATKITEGQLQPALMPPPTSQLTIEGDSRIKAVWEIITTEVTYVNVLKAVADLYVAKVKSDTSPTPYGLTKDEVQCLFRNISRMSNLHAKFLSDLHLKFMTWTNDIETQRIGQVFVDFEESFRVYPTYVNLHEQATELLRRIDSNPGRYGRFHQLVRDAKASPLSCGNDLSSCLIAPIQRIPRYRLLLTEVLRQLQKSHPNHPDIPALEKANGIVMLVAAHVNDSLRESERRAQMLVVCDELGIEPNKLINGSRYLMQKGNLTRICRKSDQLFMFWLFDDMLIYGHKNPGTETFVVNHQIPMDDSFSLTRIGTLEDHGKITEVKGKSRPNLRWQIKSSVKSFEIYTLESSLVAKSWDDNFGKLIKDAQSGTAKPLWIQDHDHDCCPLCSRKFTVVRRKHHCRACGALCCGQCSASKIVLATSSGSPERVCTTCFDKLTKTGDAVQGDEGDPPGEDTSHGEDTISMSQEERESALATNPVIL